MGFVLFIEALPAEKPRSWEELDRLFLAVLNDIEK